ncbi:MAG: ATP-binding protein [Clostridiaceae bacterium]|jgi:predicted ATP-dependent serine protease|nr:ATP-binding protein [Clostridiaceae bacterium]
MIKLIYGEKGTGKTRTLVEKANAMAKANYGNVVFIEDSKQSMYDLVRDIRFINIREFPVSGEDGLIGFICGIIAQNYDTKGIFIDGLTYILKKEAKGLEKFFSKLKEVAMKYEVEFNISINGNRDDIPEFLSEYDLEEPDKSKC